MRAHLAIGLTALALAGCTANPPANSSTTTTAPKTLAAGEQCPVTLPQPFRPPEGVPATSLFGSSNSHGNGTLWVGGLWPDGLIKVGTNFVEPDGSIRMKFGWWRNASGTLAITGRRLDGPAAPLRADIPDGYGDRGFQATGVFFATEGCWEVTGELAGSKLTFVTLVRLNP